MGCGQLFADGIEQAGGCGEVHHHMVGLTLGQTAGQFGVISWIGQVHTLVMEHGFETCKFFVVRAFGALDLLKS